jgi:hypothetical protein
MEFEIILILNLTLDLKCYIINFCRGVEQFGSSLGS